MKKTILSSCLIGLFLSLISTSPAWAASTPNYYKCENREGGEWNYGRAPQICKASTFGSDSFLNTYFKPIFFKDASARTGERQRYMNEMHAITKEAALAYFKLKKPSASAEETNAWVHAVISTAAHESYFSMYRISSDSRIKMMRGDYGHGHGLMQIDDRAHFNAVNNGIAWNLGSHYSYAMDILYTGWQKAAGLSCVKNANGSWTARTRSAWSMFNGGPSKGCRWTNPSDAWAANDKSFYNALTKATWKSYVTNTTLKTSIPIGCLLEKENCAVSSPTPTPPSNRPEEGQVYKYNGQVCYVKNQIFFCIAERDRACLKTLGASPDAAAVSVTQSFVSGYRVENQDRHSLCARSTESAVAVGSGLRVLKNINLRDTPAGGQMSVVPSGTVLQVRDFEFRNSNFERYYKVNHNGFSGYIYAGDQSDSNTWALSESSTKALPSSMARVGDSVRIVNQYGINLRKSPGGDLVQNIPKGVSIQVQEVVAEGSENKLYYKVKYGSAVGYIFTGVVHPSETITLWTERTN